ncbi:MAG: RNA-binding protein [Planctomycetaceae bacterium]
MTTCSVVKGMSMTNIYVSNLAYNLEESELRRQFERYGHVSSVRIIMDHSTRRSRGFGFVTMPSIEDADEAIQRMSGMSIKGRQIRVSEANQDGHGAGVENHNGPQKAREMFDRLFGIESENNN